MPYFGPGIAQREGQRVLLWVSRHFALFCRLVFNMHPAQLPIEELLEECKLRRDRRGGPGGQHRNKVETAVILEHMPTGITAEAAERRSQADNRRMAIFRLRLNLAVGYRLQDGPPIGENERMGDQQTGPSTLWRQRRRGNRLPVSDSHEDLPALLAELLDKLASVDYQLSTAGNFFSVSTSQLVKLLKLHYPALASVNAERSQRGLPRLT